MSELVHISVFGIGGGGIHIIAEMMKNAMPQVTCYGIDHDPLTLSQLPKAARLLVHDTNKSKRMMKQDKAMLKQHLTHTHMVIIVGCLGGDMTGELLPLLATCAKEMHLPTIAFVTMPLPYHGEAYSANAATVWNELKQYVNATITISNQQLLCLAGLAPITTAYETANTIIAQGIRAMYKVICQSAYINVDLADVIAVLSKHKRAYIGVGHGHGQHKLNSAVQQACDLCLLEFDAAQMQDTIVHVCGSRNITLADIEHTFALMTERLGEHMDIIFGMAIDEELEDEIVVTIISTSD